MRLHMSFSTAVLSEGSSTHFTLVVFSEISLSVIYHVIKSEAIITSPARMLPLVALHVRPVIEALGTIAAVVSKQRKMVLCAKTRGAELTGKCRALWLRVF